MVQVDKEWHVSLRKHAMFAVVFVLLSHGRFCFSFNNYFITSGKAFPNRSILKKSETSHNRRFQLQQSMKTSEEIGTSLKDVSDEVFDVIVIGAGIGGLSCAAVSTKCYGFQTLCLETHDTPGGVAHSFDRFSSAGKFTFDSGPSLLSGMSSKSTNPLRQVLDAIGTADTVKFTTYDGWVIHDLFDGSSFKVTTGPGTEFESIFEKKQSGGSSDARNQFTTFRDKILKPSGLADVSAYIPPFAIRNGGILDTIWPLSSYLFKIMIGIGPINGNLLTGPFSKIMDNNNVDNQLVRYWFDYLAFALSGLDASQTQAAAVAYMMKDLHKDGAVLDYPMGGMDTLIQALVQGFHKVKGSELRVNSRVEKLLLSSNNNGKASCTGVVLSDGTIIKSRRGVVCNAPLWNMAKIAKDSISQVDGSTGIDSVLVDAVNEIQEQANDMCMTRSFMHLHLGIPKTGLHDDLECHHSVLNMQMDITAEQNMVIISIPTVFDSSLAPEGYHVIHAYSAACDNFDDWEQFIKDGVESGKVGESPNTGTAASYGKSEQYQKLKVDRAEILWNAIEQVIPDVRERATQKGSVVLMGTPLTHRRYNQRYKGTYGPAPSPDSKTNVWELPGSMTPIQNLFACGDTTFPGMCAIDGSNC
jgi:phytoene dehydrogenase-like protein